MTPLAGEPVPVRVDAIEQALRELWSAGEAEAEMVVRAHAATLVVYTTSAPAGLEEDIRRVMLQHPGRALLLAAGARPERNGPAAWISARCHLTPGGHVCGEQVTLAAPPGSARRLAGLVAALRPPDVPAFLWWDAAVPEARGLLAGLAGGVDRVLFDSERAGQPADVLVRIQAFTARKAPAAGDLAWTRARPWREVVAQLFDPPGCRPLLAVLERIVIQHGTGAGRSEALLLAGWLASRLGWKAAGLQGRLDLREVADAPGGLAAVRLTAGEAVFSVERSSSQTCAQVEVTRRGEAPCRWAVALPPRDSAELLCEAMGQVGRDRVFEAALEVAARAGD